MRANLMVVHSLYHTITIELLMLFFRKKKKVFVSYVLASEPNESSQNWYINFESHFQLNL